MVCYGKTVQLNRRHMFLFFHCHEFPTLLTDLYLFFVV